MTSEEPTRQNRGVLTPETLYAFDVVKATCRRFLDLTKDDVTPIVYPAPTQEHQ